MLAPSKQLLLLSEQSLAVLSCRLLCPHSHWFWLALPAAGHATLAILLVMCCCCDLPCQAATGHANAACTPWQGLANCNLCCRYEGEFYLGYVHGLGKYTSSINNTIYEGQWMYGREHG